MSAGTSRAARRDDEIDLRPEHLVDAGQRLAIPVRSRERVVAHRSPLARARLLLLLVSFARVRALAQKIRMEITLATDVNRDSMIRFRRNRPIDFQPVLCVSPLRAFTVCAIQEARASTRHLKMA
ncbi:hypothetical protein [Caballeronia choica]|uniref:hypothetical protein n=1 Tax=Caballeronia choica TaxID=326476 RepID=UPI00190E97AE|nr:hypothetical protein [Caballeronia choica]